MGTQETAHSPVDFLLDGVVEYLAAMSPREFDTLVAHARLPQPDPEPASAPAQDD
jgi:hypothetical protein